MRPDHPLKHHAQSKPTHFSLTPRFSAGIPPFLNHHYIERSESRPRASYRLAPAPDTSRKHPYQKTLSFKFITYRRFNKTPPLLNPCSIGVPSVAKIPLHIFHWSALLWLGNFPCAV
jgi:hypothetical protein